MSRCIVTGGAGFIGSHLSDTLVGLGWDVGVIDDLSAGKMEYINPNAEFRKVSIIDNEAQAFIAEYKPDVIFHCAAQKDVQASLRDPLFDAEVNIMGTLKLLDAAGRSGVQKFVFSSTGGAIYDETEGVPMGETQRETPLAPYGIGKLTADHYLRFYRSLHSIETVSLRYANVYGPRQDPHGEAGVVAIFISKLLHREAPSIFGGTQTRDFIYVEDVVAANILACKPGPVGIFNVATGVETSVADLFIQISDIGGFTIPPVIQGYKSGEMLRSVLDYGRIKKDLGWSPRVNLSSGIGQTIAWFRAKLPK